jgi:hypothetical protein
MILARRGPSADGDGEPAVSKEEVTRGATSNERRSTGAGMGRGGAWAALMLKRRGARG